MHLATCVTAALWLVASGSGAAYAGPLKAVVFDMEPANMTMTPVLEERIKASDRLLRKLLAERGLALVDTAPQAKKIKDASPLSECNGCDQDIAASLGGTSRSPPPCSR